jgi:hypothetical protein
MGDRRERSRRPGRLRLERRRAPRTLARVHLTPGEAAYPAVRDGVRAARALVRAQCVLGTPGADVLARALGVEDPAPVALVLVERERLVVRLPELRRRAPAVREPLRERACPR